MPNSTRNGHFPDKPFDVYLLRDPGVLRRLVRSSGVGTGDLVLEFGAGTGMLTTALARTGARVIAIERNPRFVRRLERQFASHDGVRVVAGDARAVPLPRRPYAVVANIPYSLSTELLRRLLTPKRTALSSADLVVEWGFAKRVTAEPPRDMETAWWQRRYEMAIAGRIPARSFSPTAPVQSAHLVIRRRRAPGANRGSR